MGDGGLKTLEFFVVCVRNVQLRVPSVIDDSKFCEVSEKKQFCSVTLWFCLNCIFLRYSFVGERNTFFSLQNLVELEKKLGEVFVWTNPASWDTEYSV